MVQYFEIWYLPLKGSILKDMGCTADGSITLYTKVRYLWSRIYPDWEFMKLYSPFCREHPWAIPFFRVYRLLKSIICRRKAIRKELEIVKK